MLVEAGWNLDWKFQGRATYSQHGIATAILG
jgi:hypothetical protein